MNALLVYPRFPVTYWGFQYGLRLIGKRAALPPLGLLTVAALLPNHWQLRLVDLNVDSLHDDDLRWADTVLTGGLLIQSESIHEVIARAVPFRVPVVVGGPAPTASPDLFNDADLVFQGEVEGRIDELVHALAQRSSSSLILGAPTSFPDMTNVPVPRFDLVDLSKYVSVSVQYSRGCPFKCEFCDVIEIFGRKPRVKTPAQVVKELEAIHRLGYRGTLFFVDDNFIGNKSAVKDLLPVLSDWQRARGMPFEFYTEASLNLAKDPQLLGDMVSAGFSSVFVGIETPSQKALEQEGRLRERSNGDQFSRPNFAPVMEERALLRGYADLMKCLYSPRAYYSRCKAYLRRAVPSSGRRSSTKSEIAALLRTIWHIGILSPRRGYFWQLMVKAMSRGRSHLRQAVSHAVQGEHLILYTRKPLVPRMERALAEIRATVPLVDKVR